MNEIPIIITERVDDMSLFLEQMPRRGLPALLDHHFPTPGTWQGLSLGWVSTIWRSAMLSQGDHRLVHVAPWVAQRLGTLQAPTGQSVERLDCPAARRAIVRRGVHADARWAACASALHQPTVRGSALPTARGHVESPSVSASTTVSANGLWQCGQSTDDRPALPHVKVLQAVLDPLGLPLATAVVSGERADAPLSVPCIARVHTRRGRRGLLDVGDCKRAARATRACIAAQGDFSWCPLPPVPLAEDALDQALEAVWRGEHALCPVVCTRPDGQPAGIAEGDDSRVSMRLEVGGTRQSWTERRVVVRAGRQAPAAERALRARVATAMAPIEALEQRGRGKTRFEAVAA